MNCDLCNGRTRIAYMCDLDEREGILCPKCFGNQADICGDLHDEGCLTIVNSDEL